MSGRDAKYRAVGIADLMILIATAASGLSLCREFDRRLTSLQWGARSERRYRVVATAPLLASGSLGVLIVRLRKPRPSRRRIVRQPGSFAAIVAVGLIALRIPILAATRLVVLGGSAGVTAWWVAATRDLASQIGLAILVGWFALAAGGLWRAEPNWIDRTGRLVALGWITLFLAIGWQNLKG